MAIFTLTSLFADLDDFPGRLFEAEGDEVFLARTATTFAWRYGPSSDFAGFSITVTGTGFGYLLGDPVAGTMSAITIRNAANQVVLTVTGLTGFAADLSQFAASVFGSGVPDDGPGPDGLTAWSHLMTGNDIINGTAGQDGRGLPGLDLGNDTYNLGAGDDRADGGVGNDTYFGGLGSDEFSFGETTYSQGIAAFRGATVNRMTGVTADPWGGTDRFFDFERFTLSRFNDSFVGHDTLNDDVRGLRGNDVIDGGANTFNSLGQLTDDRRDQVRYDRDAGEGGRFGIVADLETSLTGGSIRGTVRDGFGMVDTLFDIERIVGTGFADTITGSRVDNVLSGGAGKDTFNGDLGFDALDFGRRSGGVDPFGVNVNLALAVNQVINDGFGNVETALSIEELRGSSNVDILRGNAFNNAIEGRGGGDTLTGGGGRDRFQYFDQSEMGPVPDRITDFAATGAGADFLSFEVANWTGMTAASTVVNGTSAPTGAGTFLFVNATDQLIWDANGSAAGGQTLVAILQGVAALSAANILLFT